MHSYLKKYIYLLFIMSTGITLQSSEPYTLAYHRNAHGNYHDIEHDFKRRATTWKWFFATYTLLITLDSDTGMTYRNLITTTKDEAKKQDTQDFSGELLSQSFDTQQSVSQKNSFKLSSLKYDNIFVINQKRFSNQK